MSESYHRYVSESVSRRSPCSRSDHRSRDFFTICLRYVSRGHRFTICFTICLLISPDINGYRHWHPKFLVPLPGVEGPFTLGLSAGRCGLFAISTWVKHNRMRGENGLSAPLSVSHEGASGFFLSRDTMPFSCGLSRGHRGCPAANISNLTLLPPRGTRHCWGGGTPSHRIDSGLRASSAPRLCSDCPEALWPGPKAQQQQPCKARVCHYSFVD